jgi:DNA polymerase elongation subunit (family B)
VDLDVTSYYPNLAITNGFHPAHLGKEFGVIYKHLFEQRKQYPKKSAESAMLKLALNGVYGDSNNQFSVFYDPLFTMSITLNGQLLLCLLAEGLMHIDGLRLIQVNTDGLTVRVPRTHKVLVDLARMAWQERTGLNLEEAVYKRMFVRDCNNYIAEYDE